MDRRIGAPDKQHLRQWSRILEQRAIAQPEIICALLDSARAAADRSGEWRNWSFLTLQIQLAAERWRSQTPRPETIGPERTLVEEDPASEWDIAKAEIRTQTGEIPFSNWFAQARQIGRQGRQIIVAVPDDASRFFVEAEYGNVTRTVLAELNIHEIHWTVRGQVGRTKDLCRSFFQEYPRTATNGVTDEQGGKAALRSTGLSAKRRSETARMARGDRLVL